MTEPVTRIVFYFSLIASVVSAVPLAWTWVSPTPATWAALVVTGLAATCGQLALTRAYSHATAASVGPFVYAGVLFAALIDWAVWHTPPDRWFAIGALLIVSAGVALLRSQDRVDIEPVNRNAAAGFRLRATGPPGVQARPRLRRVTPLVRRTRAAEGVRHPSSLQPAAVACSPTSPGTLCA